MNWVLPKVAASMALASCIVCSACGDSDDSSTTDGGTDSGRPIGDGAAAADTGSASDTGVANDAAGAGACGCSAGEGCVRFNATVAANDSELPWKLFAGEATGMGRLFAGVYATGANSRTKFVDALTLTGGRFSGTTIDVCSATGSAFAFCFFDDNGDGMVQEPSGQLRGSGDYRNSCTSQRQVPVTVSAGMVSTVTCELSSSCD